jgi:hypothetical protein
MDAMAVANAIACSLVELENAEDLEIHAEYSDYYKKFEPNIHEIACIVDALTKYGFFDKYDVFKSNYDTPVNMCAELLARTFRTVGDLKEFIKSTLLATNTEMAQVVVSVAVDSARFPPPPKPL